jgi:imidazole glycerol-phosphate synthase subunit HisH
MKRVVVVDFGLGNLHSVVKALRHEGADVLLTEKPEDVRGAERLVLPGVGAFADGMAGLRKRNLVEPLREFIATGRPFLGICVGMQLMAERGREFGTVEGLGWIRGEVVPIAPSDPGLKIPHMGWNELIVRTAHPVLDGLGSGTHAYFVHSYHLRPEDAADRLADTDYGGPLAAMIARDNLIGTQFHPEKSQMAGLRLIANFLRWRP